MWSRLSLTSKYLFFRFIPPHLRINNLRLFSPRFFMNMERCEVRCVPSESTMTISFKIHGSNKQLLRDKSETLGKSLKRISKHSLFAQNKVNKIKRIKKEAANQEANMPEASLNVDGEQVSHQIINSEAWQDGAVLKVGNFEYKVDRNPPRFTICELTSSLMVGFPVCPKLEIEFGDLEHCQFKWFKESAPNDQIHATTDLWEEAGHGRVFTPTHQDIGLRLKLKCTPGNGSRFGEHKEVVSTGPINAGPGVCTFDNRHVYTQNLTDENSLRVVSYNILADTYAQTDLSKSFLYPYCAPYALQMDYRQHLIKKELSGYNADIICLQEVDKSVFLDILIPSLDAFGLDGVFKIKERQHEGLATFFRRSKLRMLERYDLMLSEALTSDDLNKKLLEKVSTKPCLESKIEKLATTLQVTVLQSISNPSRVLCIANTHLYWKPTGGNIRLVQMAVALNHLKRVMMEKHPGASLIFSGDFNSMPCSGVFQLISEGSVSEDHVDWKSGGLEEQIQMKLTSPFQLYSAYGAPDFTNFTREFKGCLDYIFVDKQKLVVEQVIPLPSLEEVTACVALPSVSHPSDHISLVCDLKWTD